MRYRVFMSIDIEARHDREAHEQALKLKELLKSPMVRMAVQGEGVKLSNGDGGSIVYEPTYEVS